MCRFYEEIMKPLKLILLLFFLFICSITNGQTLNIKQMEKLVQSPYYSDIYLVKNKFIRTASKWLDDNDGYLITQYKPKDITSLIEIGACNDFMNCIITTKTSNYVNFLIAEAYNDDFVKDPDFKDFKRPSGDIFPVLLRKGKLKFGVAKDAKGIYKISLTRDYQETGWHFIQ
jgi:hypothetical protein